MSAKVAAQIAPRSPVLDCACPRYTLGRSSLPLLKLLNVLMGSVALLAFWLLANAQARAELARQSSAPAASDSSLLATVLILVPNMALIALLWRTGWGAWVHERLHGLLMRCLGVHPTYGVFLRARGVKGDFCMPSEPHLFGRAGFAAVTLAPMLVLLVLGVALSVASAYSAAVTLALAWQVGSCSGDLWFAWHLSRAAPGSRIEDLGNTMLVHHLTCGR